MTDLDQKELFKQAIKEWLDEQYAKLGKWIVSRLAVAIVGSFLLWWITTHGRFPFVN
jgi:hypothetical protein